MSDVNLKENFADVDTARVLDGVASMPITTWNYRHDDSDARHLGPMAQDFKAAFGLGVSDRTIHRIDGDGVALAAIQELHRRLEKAETENAELRADVQTLERRLQKIERNGERDGRTDAQPDHDRHG